MQWFAQAPSNIALIKYMGKKDREENLPDNPSLSYTLNNLLSNVVLELYPGKQDIWEPLITPGTEGFDLAKPAQTRFLNHLAWLKKYFNCTECFIVRSNNNFPHSSGLASSASSFAALTKCSVLALSELTNTSIPTVEEQANLSRHGSGSSCRSFFPTWAIWDEKNVQAVEFPYKELIHQVIVISHDEKHVASSEAHIRVQTSPLYTTRPKRARENLNLLTSALNTQNWMEAYQICWREFQDLHKLFSTAAQPFTYMTAQTKEALQTLHDFWEREGDGPLVTMDAGPNIHLLYRPEQAEVALKFKQDYLIGNYDVL